MVQMYYSSNKQKEPGQRLSHPGKSGDDGRHEPYILTSFCGGNSPVVMAVAACPATSDHRIQ